MPMYDYRCPTCSNEFEAMHKVADRKESPCPNCNDSARQVITGAPMLDPRLGVSRDFPSAARKWERRQRAKAAGQIRDANNTRFGTDTDLERDAHRLRKSYEP